ncbi:MAG: GNAT family N-acetyltransferase [Bacteroidetes bacterium]|nr:GNAT family N-acetyltransferase [Bacteroidota bacterium]
MISLREVNKDNIIKILNLKVYEEQQDQVATNAISIAQGSVHEEAWYRGIYADDVPVGFVMLSLNTIKKEYWIWRYMIDKEHQGKGYGKAALEQVVDFMRTQPDIKEIKLSYVPKEKGASDKFYANCGFIDTGEKEEGEIIMKRTLSV